MRISLLHVCVFFLLAFSAVALAFGESVEQESEYIPVSDLIAQYSQADYEALADKEAALNEARAESILASQNRAQFEADRATTAWQLAAAQLDAKNKAQEMQRQAAQAAARASIAAITEHAKRVEQRAAAETALRLEAFNNAEQAMHATTEQQATDAWTRASERHQRALAEAHARRLGAMHALHDARTAIMNDAALDAQRAAERIRSTHAALRASLQKAQAAAEQRAADLHAARERAANAAMEAARVEAQAAEKFTRQRYQHVQHAIERQAAISNRMARVIAQQHSHYARAVQDSTLKALESQSRIAEALARQQAAATRAAEAAQYAAVPNAIWQPNVWVA